MKYKGLTDKQRRFCEEYMLDFNATAAYSRAGYKANAEAARRNASRLLTNSNVQACLEELRSESRRDAKITLEQTMQEIGRVAFGNITDALSFSPNGVIFQDSNQLDRSVTAAIASVAMTETETESGVYRRQALKMHNKIAALALLADYFGVRDDFNKARATFKRYGLAILPDSDSPTGWRLERYDPSSPDT